MKILKYTFNIPKLAVEGDELIEVGANPETYTFTLLFNGIGLYEKLTGNALLTDVMSLSKSAKDVSSLDISMIKNFAKASYVKIENGAFHQNLVTADEFSKTQAYQRIGADTEFMLQLANMVVDCCVSEKQKIEAQNAQSKV